MFAGHLFTSYWEFCSDVKTWVWGNCHICYGVIRGDLDIRNLQWMEEWKDKRTSSHLFFLDPLLMVPLETATTQRQGAVGSLQVPPTAVWQVPVAQDEAKKHEAAKFDLIWVCLKIEIWFSSYWVYTFQAYSSSPWMVDAGFQFWIY